MTLHRHASNCNVLLKRIKRLSIGSDAIWKECIK